MNRNLELYKKKVNIEVYIMGLSTPYRKLFKMKDFCIIYDKLSYFS